MGEIHWQAKINRLHPKKEYIFTFEITDEIFIGSARMIAQVKDSYITNIQLAGGQDTGKKNQLIIRKINNIRFVYNNHNMFQIIAQ